MPRALALYLCLGSLLFGTVCSGADAQETETASNLVQERLRIGEGYNPAVTFETIVAAEFGRDFLWVLDRHQVSSFDHNGNLVESFGREGTGPGEFLGASHFSIDSLIHVHDVRLGRETVFRPDGTVVETISVPLDQLGGAGRVLHLIGGSQLLVSTARFSAQEAGSDPFQHVVLRYRDRADTVASIRASGALWVRDRGYGVLDSGAGFGGAFAVSGDTLVFVINGYDGQGRWFCGPSFRLCDEQPLGLRGRPFDRAAIRAMLNREEDETGRRFRESEIRFLPDSFSVAVDAVFSTSASEVWVQNDGNHRGGHLFTVLSRGGGVRRRVRFDHPVRIRAVGPLGILASQRGDYDESILVWYGWVEGEGWSRPSE